MLLLLSSLHLKASYDAGVRSIIFGACPRYASVLLHLLYTTFVLCLQYTSTTNMPACICTSYTLLTIHRLHATHGIFQ